MNFFLYYIILIKKINSIKKDKVNFIYLLRILIYIKNLKRYF